MLQYYARFPATQYPAVVPWVRPVRPAKHWRCAHRWQSITNWGTCALSLTPWLLVCVFTVKFANLEVAVSKSHSADMLQAGYWISALVTSIIQYTLRYTKLCTGDLAFLWWFTQDLGGNLFPSCFISGHHSLTGDHFSWARSVYCSTVTWHWVQWMFFW